VLRNNVEIAKVGLWVDAPEARAADVGEARAGSMFVLE
jgi:hypothetical protein